MEAIATSTVMSSITAGSAPEAGKSRRLARLFSSESGKSVIVPVDDSLIFGPTAGLEDVASKLKTILQDPPNGILAFSGVFRSHGALFAHVGEIVNLTASTSCSHHTRKVMVSNMQSAIQLGTDAVAVHVNISSKYEPLMLKTFGEIACQCDDFGMPLVAIMYPRAEATGGDENYDELKASDRKSYAKLVAHAARVAVDLGANIIKTKYTGDPESFASVVTACKPIPLLVAGGPLLPVPLMLQMAYDVVLAGGAGVSFGRNIFGRGDPQPYMTAIKAIVHKGLRPEQAANLAGIQLQDNLVEQDRYDTNTREPKLRQ